MLSRWHDDDTDAMPGTFDPQTGYYECKGGYTMDSQPDYVIDVANLFDFAECFARNSLRSPAPRTPDRS